MPRHSKLNAEQLQEVAQLREAGRSLRAIAALLGTEHGIPVAKTLVARAVKRLNGQGTSAGSSERAEQ